MAGQIHFDMTSNPQDVLRAFDKANREVDKLKGKLRDVGRVGQKTKGDLKKMGSTGATAFDKAKSAAVKLVGALGIGVGVAGAIATVNRGYETWLENIKLVSSETKQAASDIVAFSALQPIGTKAERREVTANLAARFGITERGVAFNTVQALQSAAGGNFLAGLTAAETVFAGTQVGIPLAAGTEAEIFGAAQGLPPGQMLRNLFVAGQESARTPAALAKAAPSLKFFNDPVFGAAFASVLAASVREEQLQVFTKRGGVALSAQRKELFDFPVQALQAAGIDVGVPKTQEERLGFLRMLGIDTPEKLFTFGFAEIREREALAGVIPNIANLRRTKEIIRERAIPGVLATQRAEIEAEEPFLKQERLTQIERARRKEALAFGPLAAPAQKETRIRVTGGRILAELGIQQGLLGRNFADAEGALRGLGEIRFLFAEGLKKAGLAFALSPQGFPGQPEGGLPVSALPLLEEIAQNSVAFVEGMDAVREEIRIQTEVLSGGEPALVPAIGPIDGDTE